MNYVHFSGESGEGRQGFFQNKQQLGNTTLTANSIIFFYLLQCRITRRLYRLQIRVRNKIEQPLCVASPNK